MTRCESNQTLTSCSFALLLACIVCRPLSALPFTPLIAYQSGVLVRSDGFGEVSVLSSLPEALETSNRLEAPPPPAVLLGYTTSTVSTHGMGTHVSGSHIRYQVLQSSLQRQRAPRTVTAEWRRVSDFPGNFLRTVKGCVWFLLSDSHLGFLGLTALFRNLEPCFLVIVSQTKTKSSHRPLKVIKGHILGGKKKDPGSAEA